MKIRKKGFLKNLALIVIGFIVLAISSLIYLINTSDDQNNSGPKDDFTDPYFWSIVIVMVVILAYRLLLKFNYITAGKKMPTWLGWTLGVSGFVCLYAFVIRPKQLDAEAKYKAKEAQYDLEMRMPYIQKQQTTTTVQVVGGTLPYGEYPAFPTPSCEVLWGSSQGCFYPVDPDRTMTVRLIAKSDPNRHCDLRITRTGYKLESVVHDDTAITPNKTYPDEIYIATLLSDNLTFVYNQAPTVPLMYLGQ